MTKIDQRAEFLKAYQPIHKNFVRFCSNRAFGVMSTEDLVQEAVLASLKNWERLKNKEKLMSYMMGTVNNLVNNHRRRLKFKGKWEERILSTLESRLGDPETALDVHFLLKAIEKLSSDQKEAIQLFEISGFSVREIADIQLTTEGAVKTKLSRARKRLREQLSEQESKTSLRQRLQTYTSILL